MRPIHVVFTCLVLMASAAVGQSFSGTILDTADETFGFTTGADGQYDFTLTWELDGLDSLAMILGCDDGQGGSEINGVSAGDREGVSRLSVGIADGPKACIMIVTMLSGLISDYTFNVATTDAALDVTRLEAGELPVKTALAFEETRQQLYDLRQEAAGRTAGPEVKVGETLTFLEQIFAGTPKEFTFDVVADGYVSVTAMWNRADTDLRLSAACRAGMTELDVGISESGQERFLRFDADALTGTECTVTAESPNTMVIALNIAFFTESDASQL